MSFIVQWTVKDFAETTFDDCFCLHLIKPQQYCGETDTFYHRSSKYTFVRYSYKFNNMLMFLLFGIFLCLVLYIFVKALKNCAGSILNISILFTFIDFLFSFNTDEDIFSSYKLKKSQRTKSRTKARYY